MCSFKICKNCGACNNGFMEFNYHPKALSGRVIVNIILPPISTKSTGEGRLDTGLYKTLYLFHGLRAALIKNNHDFHQLLDELDIQHYYEESEGNHSWKWWDLHIQNVLQYLFG